MGIKWNKKSMTKLGIAIAVILLIPFVIFMSGFVVSQIAGSQNVTMQNLTITPNIVYSNVVPNCSAVYLNNNSLKGNISVIWYNGSVEYFRTTLLNKFSGETVNEPLTDIINDGSLVACFKFSEGNWTATGTAGDNSSDCLGRQDRYAIVKGNPKGNFSIPYGGTGIELETSQAGVQNQTIRFPKTSDMNYSKGDAVHYNFTIIVKFSYKGKYAQGVLGTGTYFISDMSASGTGRTLQMGISADNQIQLSVALANGTSIVQDGGSGNRIKNNSWYTVIGTYNGTHLIIYSNGNRIAISPNLGGTTLANGTQTYYAIGSYLSSSYHGFNGTIDELYMLNRSVDDAEAAIITKSKPHHYNTIWNCTMNASDEWDNFSLLSSKNFTTQLEIPIANPFIVLGNGSKTNNYYESVIGIANYSHINNSVFYVDGNSYNLTYSWFKDNTLISSGNIVSWIPLNSLKNITLVGNNKGTPVSLSNNFGLNFNSSVDIGYNGTAFPTIRYNESRYYYKFDKQEIYDISSYNASGYKIGLWVYIEDVEKSNVSNFDLYLTNASDYYFGMASWQWTNLHNGWNLLTGSLQNPEDSDYPLNYTQITFLTFGFSPTDNIGNTTAGYVKIQDIFLYTGELALQKEDFSNGTKLNFSVNPIDYAGNVNININATSTISNSAPIFINSPYINYEQTTDGNSFCNLGTYYDRDGDLYSFSQWKWYKNNILIAGQTSQTLNLSVVSAVVGDSIICSENATNLNSQSTGYINSSSITIREKPSINIDASDIEFKFRREIFGRGIEINHQPEISWDYNQNTSLDTNREIWKEIGFESIRFGGCSGNFYLWDVYDGDNFTGRFMLPYYGSGCSGSLGKRYTENGTSIRDIVNWTNWVSENKAVLVGTVNMVSNGTNIIPTTRTTQDYSAQFVNWTNVNNSWNIIYWDMGNELTSQAQNGGLTTNATVYANNSLDHCRAMKAVDSRVQCGLVYYGSNTLYYTGSDTVDWNTEVISKAGNESGYLQAHFYTTETHSAYNMDAPKNVTWSFYLSDIGNYTPFVNVVQSNVTTSMYINDYFAGTYTRSLYSDVDNGYWNWFKGNELYIAGGNVTITLESKYTNSVDDLIVGDIGLIINKQIRPNLTSNHLLYASLNETALATSWNDISPYNMDLSTKGVNNPLANDNSTYANENATIFNGSNCIYNSTTLTNDYNFNSSQDFSWGASFKINSTTEASITNDAFILTRGSYDTAYIKGFYLRVSDYKNAVCYISNGTSYMSGYGRIVRPDTWYNILCVHNSKTNKIEMYIDGILIETFDDVYGNYYSDTQKSLYIGSDGYCTNRLNGSISYVVLANKTLTPSDMGFTTYTKGGNEYDGKGKDNAILGQYSHDTDIWSMINYSQGLVSQYSNHTLPIWVDEQLCYMYDSTTYPKSSTAESRTWYCDGISNAITFFELMQHNESEILGSNVWSTEGTRSYQNMFDRARSLRSSLFNVMKLLTKNSGENFVNYTIVNDINYTYKSILESTQPSATPSFFKVVPSFEGQNKTLFIDVINRDIYENITTQINVSNMNRHSVIVVNQLSADAKEPGNQVSEIINISTNYLYTDSRFNYTFPANSITTFTMFDNRTIFNTVEGSQNYTQIMFDNKELYNNIPVWITSLSTNSLKIFGNNLTINVNITAKANVDNCSILNVSQFSLTGAYNINHTNSSGITGFYCSANVVTLNASNIESDAGTGLVNLTIFYGNANTAPTTNTPTLDPIPAYNLSNINATVTVTDLESNPMKVTFEWFKKVLNNFVLWWTDIWSGIASGSKVNSTLMAGNFTKDDEMYVQVFANDTDNGLKINSSQLIINNSLPVQLAPYINTTSVNNYTADNITCYNGSTTDADSDIVYHVYNWYRNNVSFASLNMPFNYNRTSNASDVKDYSGYNHNGNLTNFNFNSASGWVQNCVIGGCYKFDGKNDYIALGNDSSLRGDYNLTLEAWAKLDGNKSWIKIIAKPYTSAASPYQEYALGVGEDVGYETGYRPVFELTTGGVKSQLYSTSDMVLGTWYHIVGTYDGSYMRIYVNGTLSNSIAKTGAVNNYGMNVSIGMDAGSSSSPWNGSIDEVMIYNKTLSPSQVRQRYVDTKTGLTANRTMSSVETKEGDRWMCEVTPTDLEGNGNSLNTTELYIGGSVPSSKIYLPSGSYTSNVGAGTYTVNFNFSATDDEALQNCTYNVTYYYGTTSGTEIGTTSLSCDSNTTFSVAVRAITTEFTVRLTATDKVNNVNRSSSNFSIVPTLYTDPGTGGGGGSSTGTGNTPSTTWENCSSMEWGLTGSNGVNMFNEKVYKKSATSYTLYYYSVLYKNVTKNISVICKEGDTSPGICSYIGIEKTGIFLADNEEKNKVVIDLRNSNYNFDDKLSFEIISYDTKGCQLVYRNEITVSRISLDNFLNKLNSDAIVLNTPSGKIKTIKYWMILGLVTVVAFIFALIVIMVGKLKGLSRVLFLIIFTLVYLIILYFLTSG